MRFTEILWRQQYPEKIIHEHQVELDEVEEVLSNNPFVRLQERGRRRGEDLYIVYGQTAAGRYISSHSSLTKAGQWQCLSLRET